MPPYRLAMGVSLPPLGALTAHWRPWLTEALGGETGLVVDLRSSTVPARPTKVRACPPPSARRRARCRAPCHMPTATRGAIARSLLESGAGPRTPRALARVLGELGHVTELGPPPREGVPWTLDVVIRP